MKYIIQFKVIILHLTIITKLVSAQELRFTPDSCQCIEQNEKFHGRYMPPASLFTDYVTFKDYVKWDLVNHSQWDSIYVHNLTSEINSNESFYGFEAYSFKPVKLRHPEDAFILNLNPCTSKSNHYRTKIYFTRISGLSNKFSDFDYKNFDNTAVSIYDVITNYLGLDDYTVLKNILMQLSYTEDDELTELNSYLVTLIKRYKITERKLPPNNNSLTNEFENIIKELSEKEVDIRYLILRDFVLDEFSDGSNEVSEEEKKRLSYIFRVQLRTDLNDFLSHTLYPSVNVSINGTSIIGIEFSPKMLVNNWKMEPANMLAEVEKLEYSTFNDLRVEAISACLPPSVMAGTTFVVTSSSVRIISSSRQQPLYNYSPNKFPFYMRPSLLSMNYDIEMKDYLNIDDILNNFTGIVLPEAELQFPFNNNILKSESAELIINNKIVVAKVKLEMAPKQLKKPGLVNILSGKKSITVSLDELEELFASMDIIYTKPVISSEDSIGTKVNSGQHLLFYIIKLAE